MGQVVVVLLLSVALGIAIAYGDKYLLQSPPPVVQLADQGGSDTMDRELSDDAALEVVLSPDTIGVGFVVKAVVNGTKIDFLVNLHTDKTRLKMSDARRIGLEPDTLRFVNGPLMANGKPVPEARVKIDLFEIGPLTAENTLAIVDGGPRFTSIIGRDLIAKLGDFEVRDGNLVIRPKNRGRRS